jgi:hypothetical protein
VQNLAAVVNPVHVSHARLLPASCTSLDDKLAAIVVDAQDPSAVMNAARAGLTELTEPSCTHSFSRRPHRSSEKAEPMICADAGRHAEADKHPSNDTDQ